MSLANTEARRGHDKPLAERRSEKGKTSRLEAGYQALAVNAEIDLQ